MKLISTILKRFKTPSVKIGAIGIYKYTWHCTTTNEDYRGLSYDVFAKVKAINNFQGLIEIEVLDITMNETASVCITELVHNDLPKYVNNKYIKWETNEEI